MAVLSLAEAENLVFLPNGSGQIMPFPPRAEQSVNIGGGSIASTAIGTWAANSNSSFVVVRLNCDVACLITVGPAPDATNSKVRLSPNQTEYIGVKIGDKVAVIQTS